MSDDFDDDSFFVDDSFLAEVDNITASAASTLNPIQQTTFSRTTSLPAHKPTPPTATTSRSYSTDFSTARNALAGPSKTTASAAANRRAAIAQQVFPTAGPSRFSRPPSRPLFNPSSDDFDEIDLPTGSLDFLDTIATTSRPPANSSGRVQPIPSSRLGLGRSLARHSSGSDGFQTHLNFRRDKQSTKGKRWDRTAFAESGRRVDAAKIKANKGRRFDMDDDEVMSYEEDLGDPLVPGPKPLVDISKLQIRVVPRRLILKGSSYGPPKHLLDPETKGTYIYPTNRSKRDYQYEIVRGCFTDNCLVALPTGLGKTFVAGVVMLNCES